MVDLEHIAELIILLVYFLSYRSTYIIIDIATILPPYYSYITDTS